MLFRSRGAGQACIALQRQHHGLAGEMQDGRSGLEQLDIVVAIRRHLAERLPLPVIGRIARLMVDQHGLVGQTRLLQRPEEAADTGSKDVLNIPKYQRVRPNQMFVIRSRGHTGDTERIMSPETF